jgi:hypothetical protein
LLGRKKPVAILIAVIVVGSAFASLYWYAYYGWWPEENFGPTPQALSISSYNVTRVASGGFNVSLNISNVGRVKLSFDKIFIDESMAEYQLPAGTQFPSHIPDWVEIAQYGGLEMNPGRNDRR